MSRTRSSSTAILGAGCSLGKSSSPTNNQVGNTPASSALSQSSSSAQLLPFRSSTKRRWPSSRGWASRRFGARRRSWPLVTATRRPRWSGSSNIWMTPVRLDPSRAVHDENLTWRASTDIDAPIQTPGSGSSAPEPSQEQVAMLADMGFTPAQARKALRETVRGAPDCLLERTESH